MSLPSDTVLRCLGWCVRPAAGDSGKGIAASTAGARSASCSWSSDGCGVIPNRCLRRPPMRAGAESNLRWTSMRIVGSLRASTAP
eukprot:scaffold6213_cov51-Phaeocystis_antarctica.AAC.4